MAYRTPVQLIETVDKPIGGYLTFRQFFYLLGGAAAAALLCRPFWQVFPFEVIAVLVVVSMIPACALAFYKVGSMGLDDYLWGVLHFLTVPKHWPEKREKNARRK
ncbi:PrgI family protein [Moorellaceae bacterium AZ2]